MRGLGVFGGGIGNHLERIERKTKKLNIRVRTEAVDQLRKTQMVCILQSKPSRKYQGQSPLSFPSRVNWRKNENVFNQKVFFQTLVRDQSKRNKRELV